MTFQYKSIVASFLDKMSETTLKYHIAIQTTFKWATMAQSDANGFFDDPWENIDDFSGFVLEDNDIHKEDWVDQAELSEIITTEYVDEFMKLNQTIKDAVKDRLPATPSERLLLINVPQGEWAQELIEGMLVQSIRDGNYIQLPLSEQQRALIKQHNIDSMN